MLNIVPNLFAAADADDDGKSSGDGSNQETINRKLTDNDRSIIAREIRRYVKIQISSTRKSLSSAYRIGARLNLVKQSLSHGHWMPWLEGNTDIKIRTANQWMSLANHRDLVIFGMRNKLTITEVLNNISELCQSKSGKSAGSKSSSISRSDRIAGATGDSDSSNKDSADAGSEEHYKKMVMVAFAKLEQLVSFGSPELRSFIDKRTHKLRALLAEMEEVVI